jgi:hypothetical protein
MRKNNYNLLVIIVGAVIVSISIIFSLSAIIEIKPIYANHNKYHLNNSLSDVTISGDDIPNALLEDIKRGIARDMKAEEEKVIENNNTNASQLQTITAIDNTKGKIILTSHRYTESDDSDFDDLFGQVKNIGNGTAEDISIVFTYYDTDGNAIGNDYAQIHADILQPEQKSSFSIARDVTKTPGMAYYEIALSWYNSDGSQEYIDNVEVTKDTQAQIPIVENTDVKSETERLPFFNTETKDIGELGNDEDDKDEDEDENNKEDDDNEDDRDEDNNEKDD